MVCQVLTAQHTGKKAAVIMGKVGITHTSLRPYKHTQRPLPYAISSPNVTCSFLPLYRGLRSCTFVALSLPDSPRRHCMWWKNHKSNQGNRYERHKQLYQNPLQLSLDLLDTHKRSTVGLSLGPQGTQKLTTNQTFHLVPEQNNLCEKHMHYSS